MNEVKITLNAAIANLDDFQSAVRDVSKKAVELEEAVQRLQDIGLTLETKLAYD